MARFPTEYEECERVVAPDGSSDADAVAALEERGRTLQRRGEFHFWMECRGLEAIAVSV
ncbi:hypothetical protein [Natronobeatus ordinarius]|uniref:hypothetical protein n=1 Tax=Natronobeatus ordinarius TaxID=2963433 RepID=UPI0020CE1245|nr:hypothetical protein [Natronobeatus ordinarius]